MPEIILNAWENPEVVSIHDENITPEKWAQAVKAQSSWDAKVKDGVLHLIPPRGGAGASVGAVSYDRGHEMTLNGLGQWVYVDTGEPIENRDCIRCGRPPTPKGHDACLGTLEGVQAACCGHGVNAPVIIYRDQKKTEEMLEFIEMNQAEGLQWYQKEFVRLIEDARVRRCLLRWYRGGRVQCSVCRRDYDPEIEHYSCPHCDCQSCTDCAGRCGCETEEN